jgi:aspartate/methionine/tyrosine aminotransferase
MAAAARNEMRFSPRVLELTFPPFDVLNTRAAEMRAAGHRVISLGQALPSFGPPPAAIAAAHTAMRDPDVHLYSADAGRASLRTVLAARLAEHHGVESRPDEYIITAGGNQAFMLALLTLIGEGDEVLLPSPYFVNHEMAVRAVGGRPVEVALKEETGFSLTWEDLAPFVSDRTRAIAFCNPSNPTGATIAANEGARIIRELRIRHVTAICDETYMQFVYGRPHWSAAAAPEWRDNVVVVSSFSKSFGMTGWRIGYLLADASVCEQAIKIQDAMIICAPAIAQSVAEAAIRESWDYPATFHAEIEQKRRLMADGLKSIPGLHWTPTNGGFFAFVRVGGDTDSAALAAALLDRAHVVTVPGITFGRSGEGYLRLSYGSVGAGDLTEALDRLRIFFAQ